jgi:DNA mismatch repair protein MutL
MPKVYVLDERTANQIAAGEVVERPASVVKELVENALDAGARRLVVEVEEGGRALVRVTDDGCGMAPDDAALALQRHATSKIRTAEDLVTVRSMGFRGEALPSIASVSRLELVTRERESLAATRLCVEGGQLLESGEHGAPPGTRVTVRDLFYNTPARLKYLKTTATETGQISDILTRLALARPDVAFRFHAGGTQVFATPGSGELLDAALALLGRQVARELIPVEHADASSRVHGLIGRPASARGARSHQFFFVNRRPTRTLPVRYALEEAYSNLLPNGRYPVALIFIEVEPGQVDVNVHPTKAEVRFEREREVRSAVYRAARSSLGAHLLVPGAPPEAGARAASAGLEAAAGRAVTAGWEAAAGTEPAVEVKAADGWQPRFRLHPAPVREEHGEYSLPEGGLRRLTEPEALGPESGAALIRLLRPLGQVHRSYIACDGPGGLYVIDQHAAHERIFYERFRRAAANGGRFIQPLLFPLTLDLTPAQSAVWREHAALIAECGFEAEPFGGSTLLIKAVPAEIGEGETARLVSDFLDRLVEERVPAGSPVEKRGMVAAALAACKASVKAKDALQPEDVLALLEDLAACESPATCPHGRPTIILISIGELAKRFKR